VTAPGADRPSDEPDRVVFRDKRKIDPVTGQARTPAPDADRATSGSPTAPEVAQPAASPEFDAMQQSVAELTTDLQRVQAEYANYRKRAERDRLAAGDLAIGRVLVELLPVLDDIDRARSHGDLTGALKAVADHLEGIFTKLGVEAFGEIGDPFDPTHHEAVAHTESEDVDRATATLVMRRGYKHNGRLLRPAMVGVSEPAASAPELASEGDPSTADATDPASDPEAQDD
jgi:molecular chaperone GrpE